MKRMTYKTLMKKVQDGYAEVYAWSGDYAHILIFKSNGNTKHEIVEVTSFPKEISNVRN
jgi:hypothetical protein